MNKEQLVDEISLKVGGITKKKADIIVTAMCESIMEAVAEGDKVRLVGFGSFQAKERKAREGRNPSTKQPMTIPATTVPSFSAGKAFKEKVANPPIDEDDESVA
ncbi:MAG: HU family DNA-binding protein [Microcoleaceae cyanobacterium]